MKTTFTLCFAFCAGIFFVSCKTSSPAGPPVNNSGTPTAVGTPTGPSSATTIDASGGTLKSPDGRLELIIPANALSAATPISIQPGTNQAPAGVGAAYSLTPNGQQFTQPVTLRFHYDSTDRLGTDIQALTVATQKDDRIWYAFNTVTLDSAAGTLSVQTKHFSWYSVLEWFKIIPDKGDVGVKGTQPLRVALLPFAPVDNDPGDDNSPLNPVNTYTNSDQVSWSVNGNSGGNQNDGTVAPASGSSSATYTAPASAKNMSSNPAAVTATVDLPGNNQFFKTPKKLYLISNIHVSGEPTVSGRISLSATVSGSKANTFLTTITETKTEEGTGTLVYDLPSVAVDESGPDRSANWNDAGFGGTANWVSEHVTISGYICDQVKDRKVTDKVTTTQTFSSASAGLQITGIGLTIGADGSYTIAIGPSTSTAATTVTKSEHSGYCINPDPQTSTNQSPIPFAQYFIPFVAGGGQKTTGKIDPAQPNSIKGTYHGTDDLTMFSYNTTTITLPLDYTITWDLTLTK
jgi:hypothetical protein